MTPAWLLIYTLAICATAAIPVPLLVNQAQQRRAFRPAPPRHRRAEPSRLALRGPLLLAVLGAAAYLAVIVQIGV